MQCPICDGPLAPFIKKDFRGEFGLNVVDYRRCKACGLAISKTHFDMSDQAWEELNHACHSSVFGGDHNPMDPRWVERLSAQRDNLVHLAKEGLLPRRRPWIDYGSGEGKLANMLGENRLPTLKYDKYMSLSGRHDRGRSLDAKIFRRHQHVGLRACPLRRSARRDHQPRR